VSAVYLQQFPSYSNYNCKKSSFLRTPAFIFCLPWGRPCGNHAKRCMNEKKIQCLPNPSQHVPIYLEKFPSYSSASAKNRRFHVPQPIFCFSLEMPQRLSRNMLHGWKDNSMLAKPYSACTYLYSIVSELYHAKIDAQVQKSLFLVHFCFPWERPLGNHATCCMDGKRIRCLQIVSLHVPIYL